MMKKQYLFVSLILLFTAWISLIPRMALAEQSPIAMLQSTADQMVAHLRENKATLRSHPSLVYTLSYKIIVPHADLDEMSKRVLPPQTWGHASEGQRAEFKKEFTMLLVRTYASALAQYTNETVRFYPIRGGYQGKSSVKVDSEIVRAGGPPIGVSYRVVNTGSQWKLYDMTVEGISMLESFRSQFADQLSRADISSLIATLKQHNSRNS